MGDELAARRRADGAEGDVDVALGDGGAANDPFNHAQNLKTLLGTILRIDINSKAPGKGYAIPRDTGRLVHILEQLRDAGNTVVVRVACGGSASVSAAARQVA